MPTPGSARKTDELGFSGAFPSVFEENLCDSRKSNPSSILANWPLIL